MTTGLPPEPTGREATIAQVIETIDETAPETKEELATHLDLSTHYLSEIFQELKSEGVITKSYVVDERAVYDAIHDISNVYNQESTTENKEDILSLLHPLYSVALQQYQAAQAEFTGETPEQTAGQLESVTNERYRAALSELRSYTLSTKWPGNRVAADMASIAQDLEIIGDRACFISDVLNQSETTGSGTIAERIADVFDAGDEISSHVEAVLFEADIERISALHEAEKSVHRQLSELFELATAYDVSKYGYLVILTRALERIIHYWVNIGELAVTLHSGLDSGHVEL